MKKYTKGFTLIELLVVIAIIGILSSVVLASLNTARNKGKDAAAQSSFAQARASAEISYSTIGNAYTGMCPTITNGQPTAAAAGDAAFYQSLLNGRNALTTAAGAVVDTNATTGFVTCDSGASTYATSIKLGTNSYCIDRTGFAGSRTTGGLLGTVVGSKTCPAS